MKPRQIVSYMDSYVPGRSQDEIAEELAQHIAALNPHVTAEVYDLAHFEGLKERYQVMSVPCLVVNEDQVTFGKKNIRQLVDILK